LPSIGPSRTSDAIRPSERNPAVNVVVFQCPCQKPLALYLRHGAQVVAVQIQQVEDVVFQAIPTRNVSGATPAFVALVRRQHSA
jgi:hypothetical protein